VNLYLNNTELRIKFNKHDVEQQSLDDELSDPAKPFIIPTVTVTE